MVVLTQALRFENTANNKWILSSSRRSTAAPFN